MIRVVLDTNVLLSAFIVDIGKPAQVLERSDIFEFLTSDGILSELEEILGYPRIRKRYKYSEEQVKKYLSKLRKMLSLVIVHSNLQVISADPDDDVVIVCAVDGNADYIVTGDTHLLNIEGYRGIKIVTPADLLDLHMDADT